MNERGWRTEWIEIHIIERLIREKRKQIPVGRVAVLKFVEFYIGLDVRYRIGADIVGGDLCAFDLICDSNCS